MWDPISRSELEALIAGDTSAMSSDLEALYANAAIVPEKWQQRPYGDEGEGFWAVAVHGSKVLWYNDIEDGFNVSRFDVRGRIPDDGYHCQQDDLSVAVFRLFEMDVDS